MEAHPDLGGDVSDERTEIRPALPWWGGIFANLRGGARLALFRKVGPGELSASAGAFAALALGRTLVMTASDAASNSFGCGNDSDFTWFGKALFDEQLRGTTSFTAAFEGAAASIRRREVEEGEDPSNPQIFVGDRMREYLPRLESRLERLGR